MGKLKYLNGLTTKQKILDIRKEIRKSIHLASKNDQYSNHSIYEGGFSEGQEIIKQWILQEEPCMLARFGSVELMAFSTWLQVNNKLADTFLFDKKKYVRNECVPNWFSYMTLYRMENNAGFFPSTKENLQVWGGMVEEDIKQVDLLFTWQGMEKYICEYLNGIPRVFYGEMYYPYRYTNPWSEALFNRKVLVVSPFAETIERQFFYRRKKLFQQNVLPEFDLKTIKAYNTIGGNNPYKDINSWFDALGNMKERMDQVDYDIALLGCGSYAFDLAAHAKRRGKKAITLCGSLQVLFGIYGGRYEEYLKRLGILNEYWVRPSDEERPEGFRSVENGAYW